MKVLLVLASLICCSLATDQICLGPNGGGLRSLFHKILEELPTEDVQEYYRDAIASNEKVRTTLEFLRSSEFKDQFFKLLIEKEIDDFLGYVCDFLHLDIYEILGIIADFLIEAKETRQHSYRLKKPTFGFDELVEDLINVFSPEEMVVIIRRLGDDIDFWDAVRNCNSEKFKAIIEAIRRNHVYLNLKSVLDEAGFHVDRLIETLIKYIDAIIAEWWW